MTQHDKIIEKMQDGDWYCNSKDFVRAWWIHSPHKRRGEIEDRIDSNGNKLYKFEERPCQHDIRGSKDFRLVFLRPTTPLKVDNEVIQVPSLF